MLRVCVMNRIVVTYHFAFEEAQPLDVILYVVPQLFLDGFPRVAHIVHFLGTLELHGGISLETNNPTCVRSTPGWSYTRTTRSATTQRCLLHPTSTMPVSSLCRGLLNAVRRKRRVKTQLLLFENTFWREVAVFSLGVLRLEKQGTGEELDLTWC